jgi:hypothetical protein
MKTCAILILALSAPLGAQAASQQRIKLRKQHPIHVDTVVLRQVDTVVVVRNDTVYVASPPATSLAAFDTTAKTDSTCGKSWFPIPIPIPIPIGHHGSTPETPAPPAVPTLPASTAPEPATIWLVGAALSAAALVRRREKNQRQKGDDRSGEKQGDSSPL